MRSLLSFALLATLVAPSVASAQTPGQRTGPYLGVQPGQKDTAPGKVRLASKGGVQLLTWVGFQMVGDGGRVFIQTSDAPVYDILPGNPDEIVIQLTNTKLHRRNDGRPLRTGYFPTAVTQVDADRIKGNKVRITISLREQVGYDLRREGNYLILDFRPPTRAIPRPPPIR